jgi:hypothetical protein
LAEQLQSKKEEKTATVAQGQQVKDKAKEKGEFKQSYMPSCTTNGIKRPWKKMQQFVSIEKPNQLFPRTVFGLFF